MTYQVIKPQSRSSGPAVNWGPLLFKTTLQKSHFNDLHRDTSVVYDEKLDFRQHLAGKISFEYKFNDALRQKWDNVLKKYLAEYFDCLRSHKAIPDCNVAEYFNTAKLVLEELQLFSMWANFQKKFEYNPVHNHTGFFSFVAYIDVPEILRTEEYIDNSGLNPGDIQFISQLISSQFRDAKVPKNSKAFLKEMLSPIDSASFSPSVGDLFIFPSYLTHQVAAFKSDVTRVSISGNWDFGE